ncbi:cytochrome c oxidase assembly protein, partial [Nostocoides japonicum]
GLALGEPVALWERATGREARWLRGWVARALMFPLVASVLSAAVLTIAFTSDWYARAQVSATSWALLQLTALVIGLLVNLPLLSEDLLPAWCGPGLKTFLAFADGLLDAIPGIVVMTTVDKWVGGALLAVAEAVGVPMIFAVLAGWVRSDEREAAAVDARLDAQEASGDRGLTTPWWLADPDLARRREE